MNNSKLSIAIKASLMLAALDGAAVFAADGNESSTIDTVFVTGSRIARDADFASPVPMVSVSGDALNASGYTVIGDVLMGLPQLSVNSSLQGLGTLFNAGQSRADMRGLGSNRTLVLLDGRRFVTGDFRAPSVDLNMIPSSMIERIDVISGGASAVYGSEAIAGVINIITRRGYEGLTLDLQGGISAEGDGEEIEASVNYGSAFAAGKGWFAVGAEFVDVQNIKQVDRDWAYPGIRRSSGVPQTIIPQSRSNIMPTATFQFTSSSSSSIALDRSAVYANSPACRTATVGALCQDPWLFYIPTYNWLQSPLRSYLLHSDMDFEISDSMTVFANATFGSVESMNRSSPSFSNASGAGTMPIAINGANPYLHGSSPLAQQLHAHWQAAGRPFTSNTIVNVGKFWEEFGTRDSEVERRTWRLQTGARGDFKLSEFDVEWETYLQHANLRGRVLAFNQPIIQRLRDAVNAIDVGGQIVCADAAARAAGCVPWNLIDGPSPEAVRWANNTARFDGDASQSIAAANLSTSLWKFPYGGSLGLATGVEYRRESSDFVQDPLTATRNEATGAGLTFYNPIGRTRGDYNVIEAYLETVAPIIERQPGAYQLSLEAAVRLADYSSAGTVDQWRLQSTWAPVQDLAFRASISTAVRAPDITEAYGPRSTSFTSAALDPCDRDQMALVTDTAQRQRRITNCSAVIPAYDPATFPSNIGPGRPSARTLTGSNGDLYEERAETLTVGAVFAPGELDRFVFSVDIWRIDVEDAISTIPVNTLLPTLCYDAAEPVASNRFCQMIRRADNGDITEIILTTQNVQSIKTSGIDVAIKYSQPLGALGNLETRIDYTSYNSWELVGFPGGPATEFAGVVTRGIPNYKAQGSLLWSRGPARVQWQTRVLDSYAVIENQSPSSRDPFYTGTYIDHDLNVFVDLSDALTLRAGVINVTDEHPPLVPEVGGATDSLSTATFDNRGRFFYAGFKYSFGAN